MEDVSKALAEHPVGDWLELEAGRLVAADLLECLGIPYEEVPEMVALARGERDRGWRARYLQYHAAWQLTYRPVKHRPVAAPHRRRRRPPGV